MNNAEMPDAGAEQSMRAAARCRGILETRPEDATPEICLEGVGADPRLLAMVPDSLKTEAMCLGAVKRIPWLLEDVPERLMTPELCQAAVEQNGELLGGIPERLRTRDLCLAALDESPAALEFVPERFKTAEVCADVMWSCADSDGGMDPPDRDSLEAMWRWVPERLRSQVEDLLAARGADFPPAPESAGPRP